MLREDLLTLLRGIFQINTNMPPVFGKLLLKVLTDVENNPDIAQIFYTRLVAPRFEWFSQMIERAQARGELRADIEPGFVISLFAGPFYFMFLGGVIGMTSSIPDAEQIVDAILNGIAAQPSR